MRLPCALAAALAAIALLPAAASAGVQARALTTEHADRPLGIDAPVPVFGWQLRAGRDGEAQTAYEIGSGTYEFEVKR